MDGSNRLPVYILAGGRSSRFGDDKARAIIDGRSLIVQLADTLISVRSNLKVVADRVGAYHDLGLTTIGDLNPGEGPLAGLKTALADLDQPGWLALVACDWVGIRPEWIECLIEEIKPGIQCVLFAPERIEPLLALYHSSIFETVDYHLASDRRSMRELVAAVPHRVLPPPPDWRQAANINRQEDLHHFEIRKKLNHA